MLDSSPSLVLREGLLPSITPVPTIWNLVFASLAIFRPPKRANFMSDQAVAADEI